MNTEKKEKNNRLLQLLIIVGIIIVVIVVIIDIIFNYVPLKEIFSQNINYTTEKEVTVTDKGIADAVDKLYNATVIVEVGSRNQIDGWGSGFVYQKDDKYGYILTNHHVVDNAKIIKIVTTDETEVDGELLGSDEYADVAVIRIPVKNVLAVAEIGKSEDVRVGDTVFAIGTPISLEYAFTVTRGIMSGKNRLIEMHNTESNGFFGTTITDSWYMNLLQIDASINNGNSGGPLANANGEVIGINNSKLSSNSSSLTSSASIENMGFSIPIEDALNIAEMLIKDGKVTRPTLGITMSTVENAERNGISLPSSVTSGAVVVEVASGSSAASAGLKAGDVITKFGEYKIEDYTHLKYYLYRYNIGDKVEITYLRNGKSKTTTITLKAS